MAANEFFFLLVAKIRIAKLRFAKLRFAKLRIAKIRIAKKKETFANLNVNYYFLIFAFNLRT